MEKELTQFYKEQYNNKVKTISRKLNGNVAAAEDVVQEAFFRAFKYQDQYDKDKGTIGVWFNYIMFNVLRNFLKDNKLFTDMDVDTLPYENSEGEDISYLKYIKRVRNEDHQLILIYYFELDYPLKDIAKTVNYTVPGVKSVIYRFKKEMRKVK